MRMRRFELGIRPMLLLTFAYCAAHEIVILVSPPHVLGLSYLFGGIPFIIPIVQSIVCARRSSHEVRLGWVLWSTALIMALTEMLQSAWDDFSGQSQDLRILPTLFQVVSFSICLLLVSTPMFSERSRLIRAFDVALALAVCGLCDAAFLLVHAFFQGPDWLLFLTLMRLVALIAAVLAMRSTASSQMHTLLRFVVIYQAVDLFSTILLNEIMGVWLGQIDVTKLDFFLESSPIALALAMRFWPGERPKASTSQHYLVRSGLPLFLSLTLVGLGGLLMPHQRALGITGCVLGIAGYILRATVVHSRSMAAEDKLRRDLSHLRGLVSQDALTGVGNRRAFDEALANEWSAAPIGTPFGLALLDIDYFKQVNDSLGHPYGDLCLCEVAGVLSRVVRGAAEHVCRFGGDEFGLILPGSGLDRAAEIVEQIRDQVKGLKLRAVGGQRITLSIGVAVVEVSGAYSVGSVLEEADQRLYEAKRRGRDRVEFRSLPEPSWQIDPAAEQDTMVG